MRKQISRLIWLVALPIVLGLAACSDNVDNAIGAPDDGGATAARVKELKGKLQNSYLYYPIIMDNMMCGALSFNLLEDGKSSKMGIVSIPDLSKIADDDDIDLQIDSIDIRWDVVPNYRGFASDGLTGDALRITMINDEGQTNDVYYTIGRVEEDSVKLVIPSEYGLKDYSMWRLENNEDLYISELSWAVSLFSAYILKNMMDFVKENIEELKGQTDEKRMEFLQEAGLEDLTSWVYDFDSMDASARKPARKPASRAATHTDRNIDYPNWMARIRDDVKVRDLVIPGSHDATTYGVNSLMAPFGSSQSLTLYQQWNSGARAFDLRVRNDRGDVRLFHSLVPCNMSIDEVVRELRDLVASHPTEGAIVIVKGEGNDGGSGFMDKVKNLLALAYPSLLDDLNQLYSSSELDERYSIWYTNSAFKQYGLLADYHPDMTMRDLRGKILVIHRSGEDKSLTSAAYASGWDDKGQTLTRYNGTRPGVLRVQDNYGEDSDKGPSVYINDKINDFDKMWDASEKDASDPTWYVNCASGYVWDIEPIIPNYYKVAEACYPHFVYMIASHLGRGIVLQDFTGANSGTRQYQELIDKIIILKHTFGNLDKVFEEGWKNLKEAVKDVVNTAVDTVKDVWDAFTGLFSARRYAPDMQEAAATRSSGFYYMYGADLVKECVYNNYLYGNRTIDEDQYTYIPLAGSPVTWAESSNYDRLFDGKTWASDWAPFKSDKENGVWYAEFMSKQPITPSKYYLTTAFNADTNPQDNPKSWKVMAKRYLNDTWTTIGTVTNDDRLSGNEQRFEYKLSITSGMRWRYFRFEVSENHGGNMLRLAEFEFDEK